MKRWWLPALILLLIFMLPFIFYEHYFSALFTQEGIQEWINEFKTFGIAGGIFLLAADMALPLPGTLIMSTMGYLYGPWLGGVASTLGLILSGTIGYTICRFAGVSITRKILGDEAYERGQRLSELKGGWIVALSRWLPLLSEIVACMAGLSKMPPRIFFTALICGAIPFGFLFAYVGYTGRELPWLMIVLNIAGPALLWFAAGRLLFYKA